MNPVSTKDIELSNSKENFHIFYKTIFIFIILIIHFSSKAQQRTQESRSASSLMKNSIQNDNSQLDTVSPNKTSEISRFSALRKEVAGDDEIEKQKGINYFSNDLTDLERKIFGYVIFHNSNTSFTPNLNMATPKSYIVGPGDELILQVYGIAERKYILNVTSEGNVNIPEIGIMKVSGLSIDALKSSFIRKLSIRYSGITGSNPNTFLEVALGKIRTIHINMVGEIYKPGSYYLPSYTSLFNALFAAGGPTVKGSFRNVQLYRQGKLISEIDIYDFLVNANTSGNIRLEDDDIILVKPAQKRVELVGEIRNSGLYEIKEGEFFSDVIEFAGGFTDKAYKEMVSIVRIGEREKKLIDVNESDFKNTKLHDGDSINIKSLLNRFTNRVQISGAINRPGAYSLVDGMSVVDLIKKADGLRGENKIKKAIIYRTNANLSKETYSYDLPNLDPLENGHSSFYLQREDVVYIVDELELKEQYFVSVIGEVNNPGSYEFSNGMTVQDLIMKSGGFKYLASPTNVEIARVSDKSKNNFEIYTVSLDPDYKINDSVNNLVLKPFDQIFVRPKEGSFSPKIVTVQGEVKFSGKYVIDRKGMKISDLILRAGGLTDYAFLSGATLIRRIKPFSQKDDLEKNINTYENIKENIKKDEILSSSESNLDYMRRMDIKIRKNEDALMRLLESENINSESSSGKGIISRFANSNIKEEQLVAINLQDIIKNPGSDTDIELKDGDILTIPEKLETVSVSGGVLYPVSVKYNQSLNFRNYINRCGGYSLRAIKNKSYVVESNGRVRITRNLFFLRLYPKVQPGSQIIIPETSIDKSPLNITSAINTLTGIITSTLTLFFLVKNL